MLTQFNWPVIFIMILIIALVAYGVFKAVKTITNK